jgi:hypothetical protein
LQPRGPTAPLPLLPLLLADPPVPEPDGANPPIGLPPQPWIAGEKRLAPVVIPPAVPVHTPRQDVCRDGIAGSQASDGACPLLLAGETLAAVMGFYVPSFVTLSDEALCGRGNGRHDEGRGGDDVDVEVVVVFMMALRLVRSKGTGL